VRIGSREAPARPARGRILADTDDEEAGARTLVFDKYEPRYDGDLSDWRARALPVALDLVDLID
jgi:hypothetical protein